MIVVAYRPFSWTVYDPEEVDAECNAGNASCAICRNEEAEAGE
jgi:hypothetical protein